VVDEWIRQAEQAARLLGGSGATASGWADASGRMFKTASDLMGAWWSLWGMPQPTGGSGVGSRRPGSTNNASAWATGASTEPWFGNGEPLAPIHSEPALQPAAGPAVRLEIASRRPVDVTVDLRKRGVVHLRVLDLRAEQGDAPRIQGTTLDASDPERVRIRLTVPDDQPPGTYHAVILDTVQDLAVGTITLKIPD
jgi:hypothetical protein